MSKELFILRDFTGSTINVKNASDFVYFDLENSYIFLEIVDSNTSFSISVSPYSGNSKITFVPPYIPGPPVYLNTTPLNWVDHVVSGTTTTDNSTIAIQLYNKPLSGSLHLRINISVTNGSAVLKGFKLNDVFSKTRLTLENVSNIKGEFNNIEQLTIEGNLTETFNLANLYDLKSFLFTEGFSGTSLPSLEAPFLTNLSLPNSQSLTLLSPLISKLSALSFLNLTNCVSLTVEEIEEIFKNLRTIPVFTGQNINLTGVPNAANADQTIATSKNWAVVI